ncbi:MAG: hypothetical protein JXB10_11980 [Pirellulales bacterium]|nr:hypothetical protein [Pirellulales bacterium]
MQVSRYDRAAGWLISLLVILGVVAFFLFITWLTNKIFVTQAPQPIEIEDIGEGEGPMGGGPELDAPEEVEELPQDVIEETISAVAEVVVEQVDQIDDPNRDAVRRGGGGSGRGFGPGTGGGVPRHWEVLFAKGSSLKTYARQLDHFRIELGVLLPNNRVAYVSKLSQARPEVRYGPADQEKRYYLTWRSGELQKADRALLAKAGVDSQGKIILKFLRPEVEADLVAKEKTRAGGNRKKVLKTVFGVKSVGAGFEFYIVEQVLRR